MPGNSSIKELLDEHLSGIISLKSDRAKRIKNSGIKEGYNALYEPNHSMVPSDPGICRVGEDDYLVTTQNQHGNFYVTTDDPTGEWLAQP